MKKSNKYPFSATLLALASIANLPNTSAIFSISAGLMISNQAFAESTISGVNVTVKKNPSKGATITTLTSSANGTFSTIGLASGNYDVTIGKNAPQLFTVAKDGVLSGVVVGNSKTNAKAVQTNAVVENASIPNSNIPANMPTRVGTPDMLPGQISGVHQQPQVSPSKK